MKSDALTLDVEREACRQFIEGFSSVLMATVSCHGEPEASYAPYVEYEGHYFVLISELAMHTRNLIVTDKISLLFIENECEAKNIFARKRVSYQCQALKVERGSDIYNLVLLAFSKKFGKVIDVLKTLKDFHLYRLSPQQGRYVAGFGRTFVMNDGGFEMVKKSPNR
ncbi:MAG: pyridoxamine 5'-phosphate oxidase family protein [Gammaproteobacteria bacterium]|nr:pyridoxamine 5'-phosphate oxidase family protein [Gammaproteobacteria bacterium]